MQDRELYEYAIIRIVPRVERGEFINAGVLLYSKRSNYLACKYDLSEIKALSLDPNADLGLIRQQLQGLQRIASGEKSCRSPIAAMDKASRFRWLSANRSTIIQCSAIHPGYTDNLENALERLMEQYVL